MVVLGEFQRLMFRAASRPGRKGAAFALLRNGRRFLYVSRFRYNQTGGHEGEHGYDKDRSNERMQGFCMNHGIDVLLLNQT